MTNAPTPLAPFVAALGQALDEAAPLVRRHLSLPLGKAAHLGVIRRMWRRGPLGAVGGRLLHLDSGAATGARFELRNEIVSDGRGGAAMLWQRTHFVDARPILGVGLLRWDSARRVLIDAIGKRQWLEVELTPALDGRAITMQLRAAVALRARASPPPAIAARRRRAHARMGGTRRAARPQPDAPPSALRRVRRLRSGARAGTGVMKTRSSSPVSDNSGWRSAAWPYHAVLRWSEDTAKLRPLTRQVFWTYAAYIWATNVSFGLLSTLAPDALLDRSPLARIVCGYITAYWASRLLVQFFYFDRSQAPAGRFFKVAEVLAGRPLRASDCRLRLRGSLVSILAAAYVPTSIGFLVVAARRLLVAVILAGYALQRLGLPRRARAAAWTILIVGTPGVERLCARAAARLSYARPDLVRAARHESGRACSKSRARGLAPLPFARWLGFSAWLDWDAAAPLRVASGGTAGWSRRPDTPRTRARDCRSGAGRAGAARVDRAALAAARVALPAPWAQPDAALRRVQHPGGRVAAAAAFRARRSFARRSDRRASASSGRSAGTWRSPR